jgi:DnaJ-class molecular chaperone
MTVTEARDRQAGQEEDDLVAADIYSQLMNDSITATGYEESQVCGACSGTGESKQGGSTCYRCKGEGVVSQFTE